MKKLYFSTFVEGLEKPIEAMLHKEGGVAVERVLNGAALYRSVREPALPYMHQTFQVLFQMKPMANVNDAVRRLLATGGWLDRFPYEETQGKKFRIVTAQDDHLVSANMRYVDMLEKVLAELNTDGCDYAIASGGGRMKITMDRYEANWPMVEAGWRTHVEGKGRMFASAKEAIETYRAETGCIDQDLPAFVVARNGQPVAKIANGDSVILFNFRGDRAQEISLAFDRKEFDHFDRGDYTGVKFAGMLQYDGDLKIPEHYLVQPPVITNTLTEVLCKAGIHEYALSETQKFGHVTYFWNGNRSGKVDENLEVYEEVPSDVIPFEQAPAMKSKEITEKMVENMASRKFQFLRCNYPNGDMVGHTGVMEAVVYAMECVDKSVKAVLEAADKYGYTVLITADHGNADQMTETKKGKTSVRTAHSLNPVPFIIYDKDHDWHIKEGHFGLANVAPTIVKMMGLEAPSCWEESMI